MAKNRLLLDCHRVLNMMLRLDNQSMETWITITGLAIAVASTEIGFPEYGELYDY